jgi:hypothetical protein
MIQSEHGVGGASKDLKSAPLICYAGKGSLNELYMSKIADRSAELNTGWQ